eukprot:gb/GEZN01007232.1/.p1 GENE.gb/GEZN01007232.1/~~gb/GEZN01007232.1/.p1  ORF type:complete len:390 (-),score=66.62 gb/GEZN01007232.1/:366-1535(-)
MWELCLFACSSLAALVFLTPHVGVLKVCLMLLVALALLIKLKPEVLLKLPMGFVPWAILGHNMPPYFDFDAFKLSNFDTWARDGDVVVTAGAKAGTNWLLYMTHCIRVKGDLGKHPWVDPLITTPWMTLKHRPGMTFKETRALMDSHILRDGSRLKDHWDHKDHPYRIFKAHETPDTCVPKDATSVLPVRSRPNVKFIVSVRPPADVLKSFYDFFANHSDAWRKMWGGFPPVYKKKEELLKDFLPGGPLYPLCFGFIRAWWPYRKDKNVLLLNYDEMLRDLPGSVRKVAAFIETPLTEEQVAKIVHLTSFNEMKKIADRFDYIVWGNPDFCNGQGIIMQSGKLIDKGKKGEGGSFFTEEEKARIQAAVEQECAAEPGLMDFLFHLKADF